MPRRAGVVCPGYLHHITQRGNNRQYVFQEDDDYILYLKRIEEWSRSFNRTGFCLKIYFKLRT